VLKRSARKLYLWFVFGVICCIALFQWSVNVAFAAPAPEWTAEASLPYTNGGVFFSPAATGSKLLAYNPSTNSWLTKTDLIEAKLYELPKKPR